MKSSRQSNSHCFALHLERLEERCVMNGDPAPIEAVIETPFEQVAQLTIADDAILHLDWLEESLPPGEPLFESVDQLPAWLLAKINTRYGDLFGSTREFQYYDYSWFNRLPFRDGEMVFFTQNDSVGSTANVQVEGVDEADLIETDGEFIYMISGQELIIVDARDAENLNVSARVELAERPTGMYLSGNRLTLVSPSNIVPSFVPFNGFISIDISYGNYFQDNKTAVTVLDISDRETPAQVQRTVLDGRMVSSRMVDGQLRLVLQQQNPNLADHLPHINFDSTYDETTHRYTYTYESRETYLSRVQQVLTKSLLPVYTTFSASGEVQSEQELLSHAEILEPGDHRRSSATTLVTFDTLGNTAGPADMTTLYSAIPAVVYATEESLYLFGRESSDWDYTDETTIWKFDFDADDHSIELAAKGTVAGQLLNQFAADEHDGYLRVVTTVGWGSAGQNLSVLEQVGDELNIVGSVTGLAPGENLYSVRFAGDRAYAVTFRRVDPLFAIDLSDPTAPEVKGELKIPGFSDYLQLIDDNHLIGIGRNADESNGLFGEMQISIFDVTDLDDPQLAHRYSFAGDRETSTIVTGNQWTLGDGDHLAFSYFADEQVIALPITGSEQVEGLQVLRIDTTTGFESLALIKHDSPILRSLQLGDHFVVVSAGKLTIHDFDDPAQELDALDLAMSSITQMMEFSTFAVQADDLLAEMPSLSGFLLAKGENTADEVIINNDWIDHLVHQGAQASPLDRVFARSSMILENEFSPSTAKSNFPQSTSPELDFELAWGMTALLE
ncbi:MAG: beta-propeller domain-containing protein [Bythopirellula sp.]|nr:beta-propeller domain-containing protein [Bythopirellula sp.]